MINGVFFWDYSRKEIYGLVGIHVLLEPLSVVLGYGLNGEQFIQNKRITFFSEGYQVNGNRRNYIELHSFGK